MHGEFQNLTSDLFITPFNNCSLKVENAKYLLTDFLNDGFVNNALILQAHIFWFVTKQNLMSLFDNSHACIPMEFLQKQ